MYRTANEIEQFSQMGVTFVTTMDGDGDSPPPLPPSPPQPPPPTPRDPDNGGG